MRSGSRIYLFGKKRRCALCGDSYNRRNRQEIWSKAGDMGEFWVKQIVNVCMRCSQIKEVTLEDAGILAKPTWAAKGNIERNDGSTRKDYRDRRHSGQRNQSSNGTRTRAKTNKRKKLATIIPFKARQKEKSLSV